MNKFWKILIYLSLAVGSFIFFLVLTFPYEVLKQAIIVNLNSKTGYNIKVQELSPSLPVGLKASKIKIISDDEQIQFESLSLNLNILPLFVGSLKASLSIEGKNKGYLDFETTLSLFDVLNQRYTPNYLYLDAKKFIFSDLANIALKNFTSSLTTSSEILLKSLLDEISLEGKINADIELDLHPKDYKKSVGNALINFENLAIKFKDPEYPIPNQLFTKAKIDSSLKDGTLKVKKISGLKSQDMSVDIDGKITQKPQLHKSNISFTLDITIEESLTSTNGFILDILNGITQRDTNGKVKIKIFGPIFPKPSFVIL